MIISTGERLYKPRQTTAPGVILRVQPACAECPGPRGTANTTVLSWHPGRGQQHTIKCICLVELRARVHPTGCSPSTALPPFPKVICSLYILQLSLVILKKNKLYNINVQKMEEGTKAYSKLGFQLGSWEGFSLHPATKQNPAPGPPQTRDLFVSQVAKQAEEQLSSGRSGVPREGLALPRHCHCHQQHMEHTGSWDREGLVTAPGTTSWEAQPKRNKGLGVPILT